MSRPREKILMVGASGSVAEKLLPELSREYGVVGIAGHRQELAPLCLEFLRGELTSSAQSIFESVFSRHQFDAIVWNVVRYNPAPLIRTERGTLHIEFDLAIALPLECLKIATAQGFRGTFIFVTSGLAFSTKSPWGSYSVMKRGQIILAEYLTQELAETGVRAKAITLGAIVDIPADTLHRAFVRALTNSDPDTLVYRVYGPSFD